ncbi:hypothetical protein [Macromonas bipunctata]|uniref:hypothetical protein n=1 Tax=Macromonas bipunctata TaxID=183670 RepID=UPI0011AF9F28|nr:hypothetical protein [Macromonas bipunctata]
MIYEKFTPTGESMQRRSSKFSVKIALTLASLIPVLSAFAQEGSPALLSREKISEISGDVFGSYNTGNVNKMLFDENKCWKKVSLAKNAEGGKLLVAECSVSAIAGALIEGAYARQQLRGSHPFYTGEAARERIMKNSGLSESETQDIMESTIRPHISSIMLGLQGAGMR